jgi:sporulation-control protein spo0M
MVYSFNTKFNMLNKVKNWFGIEGVKMDILLPDDIRSVDGLFSGILVFNALTPQEILNVNVKMVERYGRGRGSERLVNEYVLGELIIDKSIIIEANVETKLSFAFSFKYVTAPIDDFAKKNILFKGMANVAKKVSKVNSEFRIEAEAKVKGTALNPFVQKFFQLTGA